MTRSLSWIRTLRACLIAGLVVALLGAVLGAIGGRGQLWLRITDHDADHQPPAQAPQGTAYIMMPGLSSGGAE